MTTAYQFQGGPSIQAIPGAYASSGVPVTSIPINTAYTLALQNAVSYDLSSDSPVSIPVPGVSGANIVLITVTGSRVKATLTSADGSAQVIPVDPTFYLESTTVSPITALTLTRTPGVDTLVSIFLGSIDG